MQDVKRVVKRNRYKKEALSFPVGMNLSGKSIFANLAKMPHLLVAGATGSGKSVLLNVLITTLLMSNTPDDLKFIMIDPKMVELNAYHDIPHLMLPVVTDQRRADLTLQKVLIEMERRYSIMKDLKVKNFDDYNAKVLLENTKYQSFPYIVVIIDEFGSLMLQAQDGTREDIITRLTQEARAAGIHMVLTTQRPVAKVFPPTIKANLPARIAFSVTSVVESMVILDEKGAENLLGKGDGYFKTPQGKTRLVSPYISDAEIYRVVSNVTMTYGKNKYENVDEE